MLSVASSNLVAPSSPLLAFLVELDQVNYLDGIGIEPAQLSASAAPNISLVLLLCSVQFDKKIKIQRKAKSVAQYRMLKNEASRISNKPTINREMVQKHIFGRLNS